MSFIKEFATGLVSPLTELADKLIVDKDKRIQFQYEMHRAIMDAADKEASREHAIGVAQIDLNKTEANGDRFQRWWRPLVGWVCALALGYATIVRWIVNDIARLGGYDFQLLEYDDSLLMPILLGLLGLGSLRTFEKVKGIASEAAPSAKDVPLPGTPLSPNAPILGQNAGKVKRMFKSL